MLFIMHPYASVQEKIVAVSILTEQKDTTITFFISRLAFFVAIITLSAKSYSNCSYDKINGLGKILQIFILY